jgi:hypothetical protein
MRKYRVVVMPVMAALIACSHKSSDSVSADCGSTAQRGSVQVARVDPTVEEGGVSFKTLGDGADAGVVLCRDTLYADVAALAALMEDSVKVAEANAYAVVDGAPTRISAYRHGGVVYVAVVPFAHLRRAVVLAGDAPMDAIVWPQNALKHLKASGLTQGRAYQTAVREGLTPD